MKGADLLYKPVFQVAYATADLDKAIDFFARSQGIDRFYRTPIITIRTTGGGEMRVELAMAWVGSTMVELVGVRGGDDGLYRHVLRDDVCVQLHHLGYRLHSDAEWQAMLDQIKARQQKIVLTVQTPTTRALYIDTFAALGHYTEYLFYQDEASSSLPKIPQNLL